MAVHTAARGAEHERFRGVSAGVLALIRSLRAVGCPEAFVVMVTDNLSPVTLATLAAEGCELHPIKQFAPASEFASLSCASLSCAGV